MKKVVYSVSKNNRFGNNKLTGLGFITESDLVIACVSKKGNAYIRVFEDCVKNCHAVSGRGSKLSIPSGTSWLTKEACNEQILSQRISVFRR